ncbi:MAG: hypothetical protein U5L96_12235 [Owenweeksia sp.]|nr:hypothetical protein [Owenweeksia sp.]
MKISSIQSAKERLGDLMAQIEDLPDEEPYRNLFLGQVVYSTSHIKREI